MMWKKAVDWERCVNTVIGIPWGYQEKNWNSLTFFSIYVFAYVFWMPG